MIARRLQFPTAVADLADILRERNQVARMAAGVRRNADELDESRRALIEPRDLQRERTTEKQIHARFNSRLPLGAECILGDDADVVRFPELEPRRSRRWTDALAVRRAEFHRDRPMFPDDRGANHRQGLD